MTLTKSYLNLNGKYRSAVDFAATILGVLGFVSSNGALEIVNMILTVLGISGSIGEFIIPQYIVRCTRTEVVWRAYVGSKERYVQGFRCVVTHPNNLGQVVYEGDYYPTTAIANHDVDLASRVYTYFYWGHDRFEIASWPS